MLWERCKSSLEVKGFVGLRRDAKGFNAYFPLGYRLPKDDKTAYEDINLLLDVLEKYDCSQYRLSPKLRSQLLRDIGNYGTGIRTRGQSRCGFKHGIKAFAPVWEYLVCKAYGSDDARYYYPECYWNIAGERHAAGKLKPDCIRIEDNDNGRQITVIDAKYYKYGVTKAVSDLPRASDIHKQITYGEYLARTAEPDAVIINMFVLPYEGQNGEIQDVLGSASGSWKTSNASYTNIVGVMVDTKHLMQEVVGHGVRSCGH